jgi:hypothetical protein
MMKNKRKKILKHFLRPRKLFASFFVIFIILYYWYILKSPSVESPKIPKTLKTLKTPKIPKTPKTKALNNNKYVFELTTERIDQFFEILHEKEKKFSTVLNKLNVLMFENLVNGKSDPALVGFDREINEYFRVVEQKVEVTNEFVDFLYSISNTHSFIKPRNNVPKFTLVRHKCWI